jgi:hypothetical protein
LVFFIFFKTTGPPPGGRGGGRLYIRVSQLKIYII